MLSEEYSFDSLARQYGVNRDGIHYQDDASASSHLNDPDPSCMSMPGQGQLSVADDAMLPMASAPDTPVSFHFDFDRAKQAGLVAAKRSAIEPPPQPISSNPVRSLAPSTSTGAVNNEARDPSVSSWRHSEGASNSSMTVEPVPGRRIDLVATSKLFYLLAMSAQVLNDPTNVVLSAPTGAGKTVVFELAVIRMLMQEPANTKAVYLAPTKALCAERIRDWSERFKQVNCGIIELTGDSLYGLHMARKCRIIISTPEKWDSLTRRWEEQQGILSTVRLFLIDEVHILNEASRGARLEVVVTRTKLHGNNVRFVAVSATIPNLDDVARWIGRGDAAHEIADTDRAAMFQFGDEYRPCKLERFVYGYPKLKDEFSFQSYLNRKLFDLVSTHSAGRPCLVFVATRRSTVQAANTLADSLKDAQESEQATHGHQRRTHDPYTFDDKELEALCKTGVAFHHAGLSSGDRRKVEEAFLSEKLSIVCCTSTLATGVNLPAFCVILRGTKQFDGQWNELSELDIIQMMGRAGRPQFDRKGVAVIMCEDSLQQKYRELASGSRDIESGLGANLVEHVNAEIGLRRHTTIDVMECWLQQSFMWARIQKNPTYYLSRDEGICLDSNKDILQFLCSKTVSTLEESSLILRESSELVSTQYGEIMSRFFLRHGTMLALMSIEAGAGTRAVLEAVSQAEEFATLRIRQGEKGYLQALRGHSEIRFPPKQVSSVKDKVTLLIQATLSAINLSQLPKAAGTEHGPFADVRTIFSHAPRIIKAVMDIAIHRKDGLTCKTALDLSRSITAQAWDGSPAMLRQIEHVGEKSLKALAGAGLGTWSTLSRSTPSRIEMILNRNPPFGSKIIKAAQSVPRIGLDVLQKPTRGRNDSVTPANQELIVNLDITIRIENHAVCMMKSKMSKLPLSACVLTLTSEDRYIDFRRMPLWRLQMGKTFSLQCRLDDSRARIFVYAACDEIAGTLVLADLLPADLVNDTHRTKLVRGLMSDDQRNPNGESASALWHESDVQGQQEVEDADYSMHQRRCKHRCKRKCRHACCQAAPGTETSGVSEKGKKAARDIRTQLGSSSSTIVLPRTKAIVDDVNTSETLLEKIDRLTRDPEDGQQYIEDLPGLTLPKRSCPDTEPTAQAIIADLPGGKKQKQNDLASRHREASLYTEKQIARTATVVQPSQRRFLQALSQPNWLLSDTRANESHTS